MWQRIQTLYLVIATALVAVLFFSVKSFVVGSGGVRAEEVKYISFVPYLILMIIAILAGLILLGLQGWLVFDYLAAAEGVIYRWTAILPLIATILDFMAAHRIFRDQLLVESMSRLRSRK